MIFIEETIRTLRNRTQRTLEETIIASEVAGAADAVATMPFSVEASSAAAPVPPSILPPAPPSGPPGSGGGIPGALFPDEPPSIRFPVLDEAIEILEESPAFRSVNYREVAERAKDGAFAITTRLEEETVADIRDLLAENLREGADARKFAEQVEELLDGGTGLSEAHTHQVFRNNTNTAMSNGMDRALKNPLVDDAFPYRMYNATTDARVRREHMNMERSGLDGTNVYRADDPVFNEFRPPWSWNCRCSWAPLSVRQAARKGVTEAVEWWDRAKEMAEVNGGRPEEYLSQTAPQNPQFVDWPTLDGERVEIDPNWRRRN